MVLRTVCYRGHLYRYDYIRFVSFAVHSPLTYFLQVAHLQAFLPAFRAHERRGHPHLLFCALKFSCWGLWHTLYSISDTLNWESIQEMIAFSQGDTGMTGSQDCVLCSMDVVSLALSDALHMSHSALLGMGSAPWGGCRCSQLLKMNSRWK